jgi:hypothetical protein
MDKIGLALAQVLPAVTVHRFGSGPRGREALAQELAAFFEDRVSDVCGLCLALVLVGHEASGVAVIAGWESRDAQIVGVEQLRTDPDLFAIASTSGPAEHQEFETVSCHVARGSLCAQGYAPAAEGGCPDGNALRRHLSA